jgi:hypothetical protein
MRCHVLSTLSFQVRQFHVKGTTTPLTGKARDRQEKALLEAWTKFLLEADPDVITGMSPVLGLLRRLLPSSLLLLPQLLTAQTLYRPVCQRLQHLQL